MDLREKKNNCKWVQADPACRREAFEKAKAQVLPPGGTVEEDSTIDYYYTETVDEHAVLLLGLGRNVRGSMQYILNELNANDAFRDFRIYVRTIKDTDGIVREFIRNNGWNRTKTILDEKEYRRLLESVKYLITESFFPTVWIKKDEQVCINIWHGTPLKKLGLAKNSDNHHTSGTVQKNFIEADYLLYPNDYTRDHMLASYKVRELMNGRTLMLGYPRSGGMLTAAASDLSALRERLAPHGERLYAYMPTFKDYLPDEAVVAESTELLNYLDAHLGDGRILYVNLHHRVSDSIDYSKFRHIKVFPKNVDTYQLLALTEALITDYSSVFFDYLALRRQIILYASDYEIYREKRGVYMEIGELPFDIEKTPQGVMEAMDRGKTYDDAAAYDRFCRYDTPDNAKKLCQLLLGKEDGLITAPVNDTPVGTTLFFFGRIPGNAALAKLNRYFKTFDPSAGKLILGCSEPAANGRKQDIYPMFFAYPVIGLEGREQVSRLGRVFKENCMNGKIPIAQAMEYLKYDYAAAAKRMWGHARFDRILIYGIEDPEMILPLLTMEAPKTLILDQNTLVHANAKKYLKAVIRYAADYCDVAADGRSAQLLAKMMLPGRKIPVFRAE